jgi:hypothetical protein
VNQTHLPPRVVLAQPQPGDFCCAPISGEVGRGITVLQWLDGDRLQPYDHVEIFIGQPDDDALYGYTVSTYPGGHGKIALPCPAASLPGALWSSGLITLTPAQRAGIIAWAAEHENTGYSWTDYAALILHGLHIPAPGLREFIASTRHMICSQFTDAAYSANGVELFTDDRWPGYVKPGDLAQLLQSLALAE